MDAVQRMRKKAQDNGNLKSSEQQKVEVKTVESKQVIVVEQANPQVVYVPSYNPTVVYGAPVYAYPPIAYPPAGYYAAGMAISFGVGVAMGAFWGAADGVTTADGVAGITTSTSITTITSSTIPTGRTTTGRTSAGTGLATARQRQQQLAAQSAASGRGSLFRPITCQQIRRYGPRRFDAPIGRQMRGRTGPAAAGRGPRYVESWRECRHNADVANRGTGPGAGGRDASNRERSWRRHHETRIAEAEATASAISKCRIVPSGTNTKRIRWQWHERKRSSSQSVARLLQFRRIRGGGGGRRGGGGGGRRR